MTPFVLLGGIAVAAAVTAVVLTRRDASNALAPAAVPEPPEVAPNEQTGELAELARTLGPFLRFKPVETPVHWRIDNVVANGVSAGTNQAISSFGGLLSGALKGDGGQ